MRKFLPIFIVAGLFFSCQREEADAPFATDTDISVLPSTETKASDNGLLGWVALTGQTHISAEEAQETALATAMQMREVEGIVTKTPLKIGSIEVVKGNTRKPYVPTKGNAKPEQADVYIVNFANNQGYVITSADRRIPSVLAYNSYGHLGDTITNPGQAILFSYMQAYIEEQRAAFEANKEKLATEAEEAIFKQLSKERQAELIAKGYFDKEGKRTKTKYDGRGFFSVCPDSPFPPEFEHFDKNKDKKGEDPKHRIKEPGWADYDIKYGDWKIEKLKAPLLKTLWGQSGEYNNSVRLKCNNGEEAPVGCVATAVAQILAYHKKPEKVKGRIMHWEEMTKIDNGHMFSNMDSYGIRNNPIAKADIQYLLARLGGQDLLDMNYTCSDRGSSSHIGLADLTFLRLGYENTYITDYDSRKVISEIQNNRPVYMKGCDNVKSCHAWVLDGYVEKVRPKTIYIYCDYGIESFTENSSETLSLIHNNFGWEGSLYGFSTSTGWYHINVFDALGNKEYSNTYKSGTPYNYQFKKKIIVNIQ